MTDRFTSFQWKGANYRIASDKIDIIQTTIKQLRQKLEAYNETYREFFTTLVPIENQTISVNSNISRDFDTDGALPEIAARMNRASRQTGVGPMAAVAGTIAQMAVEAAIAAGAKEAVVENGGDIFIGALNQDKPLHIGLYTASSPKLRDLAFEIPRDRIPLAVCSSSSTMGHSLSFGNCELVSVFSADASLADAAATAACNSVISAGDIESVLKSTLAIRGIEGVFIAAEEQLGMIGDVPKIVGHRDSELISKISKNRASNFPG